MEIKVCKPEEIYKEVGEEIINLVNNKKDVVLGLATGSTPIGVYKYLVKANKENRVTFKHVRTFNLDEYIGLNEDNDQSYRYFMNTNLFNHIDIDKNNTRVPSGLGDYEAKAKEYDKAIEAAGGIDFQILGIGSDGHIAFNEPGTPLDSLTHVAELAESTIIDNARFFASKDEVPTKAVTMGLESIMRAKRIVLIALGANKADAIEGLIKNDVSINLPCSVLKNHKNVTIYCDELAYSKVKA